MRDPLQIEKRNTKLVDDALQTLLNTEEVSTTVMIELGNQTNQMEKIRDNLNDFNSNVGTGRKIINSMQRRVMTNKLILSITCIVLLLAIIILIYFYFAMNNDAV